MSNITIYDILELLEKSKTVIENYQSECTSFDFNYEILNDNTVVLETGWSDYEESESYKFTIKLSENCIFVQETNKGYSVYGGFYDNARNFSFDNLDDFKNWLSEI